MLIINENADFSACGLGQIKYKVDDDVKQLLTSVYSGVTSEDMISFQTFIDAIGGLNGTIWGKLTNVYMYIFASNRDEAEVNLKTGQRVEFMLTDGTTNMLTCIHGEGLRLISGRCFWPYTDNRRTSKPFGIIGRNLTNAQRNVVCSVTECFDSTYRTGGARLYTTANDNEHSVVLPVDVIRTSIAISFQSESDVTIVSNGVEVPNSNTTPLPLSNNTNEVKSSNFIRIVNFETESIDYSYQFQFTGFNFTKAETIQIAAAADKMVL